MNDNGELSEAERRLLDRGYCPNCGHRGFVLGPRGAAAINIECGRLECRARFNVMTFSRSHHIAFAHRIPSAKEGGGEWP